MVRIAPFVISRTAPLAGFFHWRIRMVFNPFRGRSMLGPSFDSNNDDHFSALKQHLGFAEEPAQDTDGYWTIGYGQRLSDSPGGPKPAATMSEPFAADMLREQLAQDPGVQVADAGTTQTPQQPAAKGFVQLPQNVPDSGYYNYGTPNKGAAQGGRPETVETIEQVGAQWKGLGTGSIGIGNMSLEDGAKYDHKGHQDGLSIDIRPRRMDEQPVKLDTWDSPLYDRDATQELVNRLRATGNVDSIWFNDPNLKGVTHMDKHDNHLHVNIKPRK
jgi:penicillin-insensitive murein endopeptidase